MSCGTGNINATELKVPLYVFIFRSIKLPLELKNILFLCVYRRPFIIFGVYLKRDFNTMKGAQLFAFILE